MQARHEGTELQMPIGHSVYIGAAEENAAAALLLHEAGQYAPAHYLAGVAVECVLRACITREVVEFDSRHQIKDLCKRARFYSWMPQARLDDVTVAMHTVASRWSNDHRYRSAAALAKWLSERRLDQKVARAKRLPASSAAVPSAMQTIVTVGCARWQKGLRNA